MINIPRLQWLSDPKVFRINRIDAHSDHLYYENKEDMYLGYNMPLRQSLNGKWKFSYAINPSKRIVDFYKTSYDCSSFDEIDVPAHIQLQGYDKCQYINTMYPWDGHEELRPPSISKEYNPVGSYVKQFTLKNELVGKNVFISFQGVETAFYLWVNGKFVGYSEDTFTPSEFELTSYLVEGENKLAVEVYKRSSASWIEDQDFWRFSGIFRDVYLYGIPKSHINDIFVKATLDHSYTNGILSVDLKVVSDEKCYIKAYLEDNKGNLVHEFKIKEAKTKISLSSVIENVTTWSAETPYLYSLYFELLDDDNRLIEIVKQKVGFRTFQLINNIMHINGKRIVFKGINRHEFSARNGRAISKEEMLWDIKFLKQNNINSVRTSHYPNHSLWYDLCDEYGIYLIDEANLESHGSWQKMGKCDPEWNIPGDLPEWKDVVVDRAESMLERDKNHPSILIWSCGNESYAGSNILEMTKYFHKKDNTRLVHYEGVVWNRDYDEISDIESRMYAKPKEIEEYLSNNPKKAYISCEYMHAMGNSCGGMSLYTDLEDKYPMYQGGFIWDYIDQAIYTINEDGKEVLAYGGDFDDRATDYCFCTDGIVYADRTPSPKVQEVKHLYANIKFLVDENGFKIVNNNLFIDTGNYEFVCTVEKGGEKIFEKVLEVNVKPQREEYIEGVYQEINEVGEYTYNVSMRLKGDTLWAEKGHEIAFGQYVKEIKNDEKIDELRDSVFKVVHGDVNIGVIGNGFKMLFSKQEGGIISLCYDDKEYITRVPKTSFFRANTDNDKGNGHNILCAQWQSAGMNQHFESFKLEENKDEVLFIYNYVIPTSIPTKNTITYIVKGDGSINIKLKYYGIDGLTNIPLYGMDFKLKKELNKFIYYGYGPEENYIDRNNGARLGIFENTAENNLSRYLIPQECGNRTGIRWVKVKNSKGNGLKFTCDNMPFELSVLPCSPYELENAMHKEELPPINYTWVRIIAKQMGVGGDDSWGAPVHDEYLITAKDDIDLSFTISKV